MYSVILSILSGAVFLVVTISAFFLLPIVIFIAIALVDIYLISNVKKRLGNDAQKWIRKILDAIGYIIATICILSICYLMGTVLYH